MRRTLLGLALALAAAAGWPREPAVAADDKPAAKAEVKLEDVDLAGYGKRIAALKGKPVLVDVWATWCVPCRQKFPKFVKLAAKHAGKAAFVSASLDLADTAEAARKFLADQKAAFTNLRLTDPQHVIEEKLGFEGVPAYLLYDAEGRVALRAEDLDEAAAKLDKLLAR